MTCSSSRTCHMAEACARLCTSGLRPRSQSTISVPTRQWRTVPRPGTLRSRMRAEAGEAEEAAMMSVFKTLPIIMARSLGDLKEEEENKQIKLTNKSEWRWNEIYQKEKWTKNERIHIFLKRLPSLAGRFGCCCWVPFARWVARHWKDPLIAEHCWVAMGCYDRCHWPSRRFRRRLSCWQRMDFAPGAVVTSETWRSWH